MPATPTFPKDEYNVGWICALDCEMAAAKAMLDEVHGDPEELDPTDQNHYTLGQIADHKVVIAGLPAGIYGTNAAATVAKDMSRTFKSIRIGLMVGIGGGAPSDTHDIRLGDIVVSQPSATSGGVIQHDLGKTVTGSKFQRTGMLNSPPKALLTALKRMKTEHELRDSEIPKNLDNMLKEYPKMVKRGYTYQGAANDRLYQATYDHLPAEKTCQHCDPSHEVKRDPRDSTDPIIHYGNIASGNQVIKDGITRDRLREELDVLCFEMEAAGLMSDFPCLVIRGICDYCDSHKNKSWQNYAATTAAAFAKEFLSFTRAPEVRKEKPVAITQVSDAVLQETANQIYSGITLNTQKQETRYETDKQRECHRVFKTSTYEKFKNINPDRVPGTCLWVLQHERYIDWQQSRKDDILWISADPGCGKSVLSKSLIENELQDTETHVVCYFFFKDNEEQNSISTALCALLHQLFARRPRLLEHALVSWEENGDKLQQEADKLWRILLAVATDPTAPHVTCVLDALDECRITERTRLIRFVNQFYTRISKSTQRKSHLKFLLTSRPYADIERDFRGIPDHLPTIRLFGEDQSDLISAEIDMVIQARVLDVSRELNLQEDVAVTLEKGLLRMTHRTYLWLYLVIEEVRTSLRRNSKGIMDVVDNLPETVEEAYEILLSKSSKTRRQECDARTLLHIIVAARRPLALWELDVAFQIATQKKPVTSYSELALDGDNLAVRTRNLCGLFVFINNMRVYLIHQTAKEFLVAKSQTTEIDSCWKHSFKKEFSEMVMAKACTRYLLLTDLNHPSTVDGCEVFQETNAFRSANGLRPQKPVLDFMDYSALNWTSHFREAKPDENHSIIQEGLMLCNAESRCVKIWLPIYWKVDERRTIWHRELPAMVSNYHIAALCGLDMVIKLLLSTDHDQLDMKSKDDETPLMWAVTTGFDSVVKLLLESGKVNVNAKDNVGRTPIYTASLYGFEGIVKLLLASDRVDANSKDSLGETALHIATFQGFEGIVKLLLDSDRVDAKSKNFFGETALHVAVKKGYETIFKQLLC